MSATDFRGGPAFGSTAERPMGMTGINLARQMLQSRPDIPIILCTGYSSQMSEEQVKAEGIRAFAKKPLTMNEIATLLRKVLDQKKTSV